MLFENRTGVLNLEFIRNFQWKLNILVRKMTIEAKANKLVLDIYLV